MATYYVRSSGGNDGNAGTSFGAGWATIQKAADTAMVGDLVLICADGTHTPVATVDFDTNSGTAQSPIVFRGASATGVDNGTIATITGVSAAGNLLHVENGFGEVSFENLRITASQSQGIYAFTSGGVYLKNVRIDNCADNGMYMLAGLSVVVNSEIDHNGNNGLFGIVGSYRVTDCKIHHNSGDGFENDRVEMTHCQVYRNGGCGIKFNDIISSSFLESCDFVLNTSDGVQLANASTVLPFVRNNIFRSNGGYGLNYNGSPIGAIVSIQNNCVSNNTSGQTDVNGGTLPGTGNVTSNPLFTNEGNGTEDLSLQAGSPCIAAGSPPYMDIGALQHQEVAPIYTAASNVRNGTDRGDGVVGTLVVPAATDVKTGVIFDNGTVGTFAGGGGSNFLLGG